MIDESKLPPLAPDAEILKQTAAALLDEPMKITITIQAKTPKEKVLQFLRITPKQKIYMVKGATLRTMLKVSKLLLDVDYNEQPQAGEGKLPWAYKVVTDNMDIAVRVIAIAIHNHNSETPQYLIDLLYDNSESIDYQKIALSIIRRLDIFTFTDTITSLRKISILRAESPKSPEEIIAPEITKEITTGEELDLLSNILGGISPAE